MTKAFVAGATGYTGQKVVHLLLEQGITTVAHIRPDSSKLEYWKTHFEILGAQIDSSPWHAESLKTTLLAHQPQIVFGLLGTTKKRARQQKAAGPNAQDESYDKIDYGYTAMLIDAAAKLPKQPRFMYLSSLGVSANAPGAYMQARWKAQKHLEASGLPYTIVQPCFITGADRQENRPLERVGAIVTDALLSTVGAMGAKKLQARYKSMNAKSLAKAMVALSQDSQAINTIAPAESLRGFEY